MKLTVHRFETLESTNAYARDLLAHNEINEGEVILADSQSNGYGRKKDTWDSPLGNIYCTMILDPKAHGIEVARYPELAFVSGVALLKAVQSLVPDLDVKLKWPNDLIINQRKLAGIVIEVENEKVALGIGMNVFAVPHVLDQPTTILSEYKSDLPELSDVFHVLLKYVWHTYDAWLKEGFNPIREEWIKRAYQLGNMIERDGKKGTFKGIDINGAMILNADDKEIKILS